MSDFDFLHDATSRTAIREMVGAAARHWAPDEADLVDLVTEEYLRRVQEAGELLYPTRASNVAFGIGDPDLLLLVILPVVTGFMANLLASMGVLTMQGLHHRGGGRSLTQQPSAFDLSPERVNGLVAPQARVMGLKDEQIDQLARLISTVLITMLATHSPGNAAPTNDPAKPGSLKDAPPTAGSGS